MAALQVLALTVKSTSVLSQHSTSTCGVDQNLLELMLQPRTSSGTLEIKRESLGPGEPLPKPLYIILYYIILYYIILYYIILYYIILYYIILYYISKKSNAC
jgi:hypothetical protein